LKLLHRNGGASDGTRLMVILLMSIFVKPSLQVELA
jgi:hypothetical protein